MWAQKGTGRARHGSAKLLFLSVVALLMVLPVNKITLSKFNQREKLIARNSVFIKFAKNNSLLIVDGLGKTGT